MPVKVFTMKNVDASPVTYRLDGVEQLRVSDATSGTPYKTANGFASYYGDYDAIAITNAGKSVTVSGQGQSFSSGPGSIWFNRQT